MNQEKVAQYQEEQINRLKYTKDLKAILAAKPEWEAAPESIKFVGLNIQNGEDFGKWCWLDKKGNDMDYIYQEPRPE